MNAWRDLQPETLAATREQMIDVLLRSGQAWIVRRADGQPYPTMAEIGLRQPPLAWPRLVGVLGRDPLRLDLASFVAQVTGTDQPRPLSETDLERGFNVLTGGRVCRPTTLVVDAAERLTPEAIHYIQFAAITAPTLQVVLITTRQFRDRLKDFPVLYARLQPDLVVDALSTQSPPASQALTGNLECRWNERRAQQQTGLHGSERFQDAVCQAGGTCQTDEPEGRCASLLCVGQGEAADLER